jgi:hypothetical protein
MYRRDANRRGAINDDEPQPPDAAAEPRLQQTRLLLNSTRTLPLAKIFHARTEENTGKEWGPVFRIKDYIML